MSLPQITMPIFECEIPSNKAKAKIRPITAKEEKILLIAKEGGENAEILGAVKQIVNNCLIEPKNALDSLPLFDMEYLYLRIRAVSMSNKLKLAYRDNEDGKTRDFEVDLDTVQVKFPDKDLRTIKVNDKVTMTLKYPSSTLYDDKAFLDLTGEKVFEELTVRCLDKVHSEDKVFDPKTMKPEEVREWVDGLPVEVYDQIKEFFVTLPTLNHEITYTNDNGKERKIVLATLNDFFTLR